MEEENMWVERGKAGKALLTEFTINFVSLGYLILSQFLPSGKSVYLCELFVTELQMHCLYLLLYFFLLYLNPLYYFNISSSYRHSK